MNSKLNEPVNIGNPVEWTVKDLADLILKLTNSSSKINYLPLPEDDPKRRKPDISRVRRFLNWQPKVGLEEGLKATIPWFESAIL